MNPLAASLAFLRSGKDRISMPLLPLKEAARELDCHIETCRSLIHRGLLKGTRVGRLWKVAPAELHRYIAAGGNAADDWHMPENPVPEPLPKGKHYKPRQSH
jgi:excisionase family DNA binding protein